MLIGSYWFFLYDIIINERFELYFLGIMDFNIFFIKCFILPLFIKTDSLIWEDDLTKKWGFTLLLKWSTWLNADKVIDK